MNTPRSLFTLGLCTGWFGLSLLAGSAAEIVTNHAFAVVALHSSASPLVLQPSASNNYTRIYIEWTNDGAEDVYGSLADTVKTNGVLLKANGGSWTPERVGQTVWQGAFSFRSASTNGAAHITGLEIRKTP